MLRYRLKAQVAENLHAGGGNQSSRVENAVHKLMELEEDLNKEIDRLVDEVRLAEAY